jgi:hypothetical protein
MAGTSVVNKGECMAELSGEVDSLLKRFQNTKSSSDSMIATEANIPHPVLLASHKFVEAERALANASRRVEAAEKELSKAREELGVNSDLFDEQKAKLAELLK